LRRFEYRVIELLEKRLGGALSGHRLEEILNDEAREGWMLNPSLTPTSTMSPLADVEITRPG
jgi:hypothetical protein